MTEPRSRQSIWALPLSSIRMRFTSCIHTFLDARSLTTADEHVWHFVYSIDLLQAFHRLALPKYVCYAARAEHEKGKGQTRRLADLLMAQEGVL